MHRIKDQYHPNIYTKKKDADEFYKKWKRYSKKPKKTMLGWVVESRAVGVLEEK